MLLFDEPRRTQATTFAEPDDGKSFTQRAMAAIDAQLAGSEAFRLADQTLKDVAGIAPAVGKDLAGFGKGLVDGSAGKIAAAAWDQQRFVETSTGRQAATEESYDRLIAAVKQASGVVMQNPLRGGYRDMAELELKAQFGPDYRRQTERNSTLFINAGVEVFKRQLGEYMDGNPAIADAVQTAMIDFSPDMIARRADRAMQEASADSPSLLLTLGAGLVGGIVPAMRDPINAVGLLLGAGPSAAKTVAGRLFDVALREALINGGITAAQQPFVQDWRREAGLDAGFGEAAQNVAMGAAFGALFGGGAQALRELAPRAAVGEAGVKEVRQALQQAGVKLDDEARTVLRAAEAAEQADDLVLKSRPAGLPDDEAREVLAQAVRRAEDPLNEPVPEIPVEVRPVNPARARVTDESLPVNLGDVDTVDNKPVSFRKFDPSELTVDAAAMQYKGGGDEAGVTDRLRSVTRWDPLAGGRVFVFERLDGTQVIADGHQRMGLAKRIQAEDPSQKVELVGHLFREADGWTATDVRAMAAKKNMQEGSGTPLDAARILRDKPDLADGALPKGGTVVRDGLFLARLSNDAFNLVNAGIVPEAIGARVGALAPDPVTHLGIMNDLVRFKPDTQRKADLYIGESLRAPFVLERQEDMFGVLETTVSLMSERVRVLNDTINLLASDKRVFAGLERNATTIESAGNQLARDTNQALAAQAASLQDMIVKLAQRMGPISDALNEQALALKNGAKPAEAARAFAARVQDLIERDGLPALLAEPQLRPTSPAAEPGTPQAAAAAERVEVDPFTMDMFGAPPARPAAANADPGAALAARAQADFPSIVREYAALRDSEGGRILNTDVARELSPEYVADRTRSADVHEAASAIVKRLYAEKLAAPTPPGLVNDVIFTAGGTGAGKTTGLRLMGEDVARAELIYDTNMNTYGSARQKIDQALAAGRNVVVAYTYRDPVEALVNGALPRAMRMERELGSGRTVPLSEHVKTHVGAIEVMDRLAADFADNPNFTMVVIDNSRGPNNAAISSLTDLRRFESGQIEGQIARALDAERSAGNISEAVYNGFAGVEARRVQGPSAADRPANAGQSQQEPALLNSERTAAGEQTLIPGVEPVTDQQRMAVQASRPLQGGDAAPPAGGLFDTDVRQQVDLEQLTPLTSRDDPSGTRLVTRQDALAETDLLGLSADVVKACKS